MFALSYSICIIHTVSHACKVSHNPSIGLLTHVSVRGICICNCFSAGALVVKENYPPAVHVVFAISVCPPLCVLHQNTKFGPAS